MTKECSVWRLAEDAQVYGEHAGWYILTSPDGEVELSGLIFETVAAAEEHAVKRGMLVVPSTLQGDPT